MGGPAAADGVVLRAMVSSDLPAAHALTDEIRWPHRLADWEQVFRHGRGVVAERDGAVVGAGLRWRWGARHGTVGLVVVTPAAQGRRIGQRLMTSLLQDLGGASVLLHATAEGRGLYERLGFVRTGEVRQHQGLAQPAPLVALASGRRLRPASLSDADTLAQLDERARGMPRAPLIAEFHASAEAVVVLDDGERPAGFGMLRRFGRGHVIGPVVAPDAEGARALIAHLAGMNAGRFTRIDVDAASGLPEWLEGMGLQRVDAPVAMWRGERPVPDAQLRTWALATQALA